MQIPEAEPQIVCGEQGISPHSPTYTHALGEVKCLPSWYDSQAN